MRVGIALGSNLEDRLHHLRAARDHLAALHNATAPFLCSGIYETRPVDCPTDSPPFLNAAVELSSTTPPVDLLHQLLEIERLLGRPANHPFHAPRTIDLDLLYCDNIAISLNSLIMPHPRLTERLFVLQPLADICPERILPSQRQDIRSLRDALVLQEDKSNIPVFICRF